MKAVGKYVIIEHKLNEEVVGSSGLVESLAKTEADKKGTVVSVSDEILIDGVGYVPNTFVKVGDVIWFTNYSAQVGNGKGDTKLLAIHVDNIVSVE